VRGWWRYRKFAPTYMEASTQSIHKEIKMTSGYAPVNGIKMYYEIHGEGNIPLVLIHGGGSTIESTFGNLIPLLNNYGKLIAVELQAHGRTSDRDAPEFFEQDADDVAALLKYLQVDKANFIGFSNGGTTTMQIAIRHRDLVNKVILISASFKREGFIPGFFESMPNATLDNMPAQLKEDYLKVGGTKEGLFVMFIKDRGRMMNFKDIDESLIRAINVPALIISGDRDVTTVDHAVLLSKLIKGSRLLIVPGTHGSFIGESCSVIPGSRTTESTAIIVKEFLGQ
jgi:pimeloyl-ACP methyl ester carboxylesterase